MLGLELKILVWMRAVSQKHSDLGLVVVKTLTVTFVTAKTSVLPSGIDDLGRSKLLVSESCAF